jgi:D-alanyl-D-alanine carboxypeptidase/D-alanyl-D-alanine-endopeptidase (penicillin-binding protein 4)
MLFHINGICQVNSYPLTAKLDSLTHLSFFDTSIISIDVYDLKHNTAVYTKNNKLLMRPGSNMKLLTSAAAIHYLGNSHSYKNIVEFIGPISKGVLHGNINIATNGNPLFSSEDVDSIVSIIKLMGVKKIDGKISFEETLFDTLRWGSGWMWDDDPDPDAPYISQLSINRDVVAVNVGYITDPDKISVSINPDSKFFVVDKKITVQDSLPTKLDFKHQQFLDKEKLVITGVWNKNDSLYAKKMSILRPEKLAKFLLEEKCYAAGIKIKKRNISFHGDKYDYVGCEERTDDLDEVLHLVNKESNNFCAEMLLRELGKLGKSSNISAEDGLKYVDSLITVLGFQPANYKLADGSGVSHYNLVSAELLNALLKSMYFGSVHPNEPLKNSLPIAGVDGTLKYRMKSGNAHGHVFAKTGTISGVSCLSGYVTGIYGAEYSFSILMQIHPKDLKRAHQIQDAICEVLASN